MLLPSCWKNCRKLHRYQELIEKARVLDNFYIPARYPSSHPQGAPFEHYGSLQSGAAINYAREIIEFTRSQMA
jgi:HEPN domain-containing protein